MDKHYEAVKEILEDQIKKIVKKGDISPQELDNLYKASAICLDFETKEAMKKAEEQQKQSQGGQSQQGGQSMNSYNMSNRRGSYNMGSSNDGGNSNHYPWFMYGGSMGDMSMDRSNSYGPIWNQEMENKSMREVQSRDMGNSNRRGVDGTGRGNSRDNSYNRSYEGAYDGAYDGSYDGSYNGSYDGSMDASMDNSYRRGRDARTGRYVSRDNRGYSRAMDKQRMIGKLEDMMDDAPSEKERRTLQQCVDKLERQ